MKKFKVLVVDDDSTLTYLLRQRLEYENFEVESANSAPEGYLVYLGFRPDLVITDIHMGEENGLDLIKHIRRHDPRIGIIYMTGDLNRYGSELKMERDVFHACILVKPFSGRELLASITTLAQGGRQIAA